MTLSIAALVLFAALLHASWNALLKGGSDGFWTMTVMGIATSLACAALVPFLPVPARASWPYIAGSALLHVGYNAFLIRAYRSGDFGSAYPIARGSSPLLVTLGAALRGGRMARAVGRDRHPAGQRRHHLAGLSRDAACRKPGIFYALGTGLFIAAYSVTDGIGGRLSGSPVAYTVWMCLAWGVTALPIYLLRRRGGAIWRGTS